MTTATRTFSPRPRDIERRWYVVDADGVVLGRLASEVAKILRGKHKPIFAPHVDTGDHVIVINARGIRLTGGKEEKKIYYRHSGYPGGLTETNYTRLLSDRPGVAVEKAIRGMLPKNRLGRAMFKKLTVYERGDHPHKAQKPVALALGEIPKWEGLPTPVAKPAPTPKPKRTPEKKATAKTSTAKAAAKKSTAKGSTAKTSTAKPKRSAATATATDETAPEATPKRGRGAAKAAQKPAEKAGRSPRRSRRAGRADQTDQDKE